MEISHTFGKAAVSFFMFVIALTCASTVSADPVTITGGSIQFTRSGPGSFSISGAGFSATGTTAPLTPLVSLLGNGFIVPGGTGQTGGSIDSQDSELFVSGSVLDNGILFQPNSTLLVLGIGSQIFQAPAGLASGFLVIAPFTLNSSLIEGYPGVIGQGEALFSSVLSGSGITTLSFLLTPSGQYQLQSQTFTFGQSVSGVSVQAVPEPATLLLFGAALVPLIRTRRRS